MMRFPAALMDVAAPRDVAKQIPILLAAIFPTGRLSTAHQEGYPIRVMTLTAKPAVLDAGPTQFTQTIPLRASKTFASREPGVHWDTPGFLTVC